MSWGSLGGGQIKKKSSDPLPGFLMEEEVIRRPDGPDTASVLDQDRKVPRSGGGDRKGYGIQVPRSVVIQISHKAIFTSFLFFAASVLLSFGVGFFLGRGEVSSAKVMVEEGSTSHRPLVPESRAKKLREGQALSKLNDDEAESRSNKNNTIDRESAENVDDSDEAPEDDEELLD